MERRVGADRHPDRGGGDGPVRPDRRIHKAHAMTPVCRVTHLRIIRTDLSGVGADLLRWVLDRKTSESADEAQPLLGDDFELEYFYDGYPKRPALPSPTQA